MPHPLLTAEDVLERIRFAARRKEELVNLNGGDLPGADPHYRQQLVQEFFFHLVGGIEVLAQLANDSRSLGLDVDRSSVPLVRDCLPPGDPLRSRLVDLYATVRGNSLPRDPYSGGGYIFRIWNYRHQVTHRRKQPFLFNIGMGTAVDFGPGLRGRWREYRHRRNPDRDTLPPPRTAHLILDPRDPPEVRKASMYAVSEELDHMHELVSSRCEAALVVT